MPLKCLFNGFMYLQKLKSNRSVENNVQVYYLYPNNMIYLFIIINNIHNVKEIRKLCKNETH